jgi:hypothetical protein
MKGEVWLVAGFLCSAQISFAATQSTADTTATATSATTTSFTSCPGNVHCKKWARTTFFSTELHM